MKWKGYFDKSGNYLTEYEMYPNYGLTKKLKMLRLQWKELDEITRNAIEKEITEKIEERNRQLEEGNKQLEERNRQLNVKEGLKEYTINQNVKEELKEYTTNQREKPYKPLKYPQRTKKSEQKEQLVLKYL